MPVGIGPLFDYPFYLGGAFAGVGASEVGPDKRSVPTSITLDGYLFGVDLKDWRSGPEDTFRDTIVGNGQLGDDSLFSAKGAWVRNRFSWHHGIGQGLADFDENADPYRHNTSHGIRWWNRYQLSLAKSTTMRQAIAGANPVMCRSGIYAFLGDGANLYRSIDLITWTAMTAPGGTIQALATDGTDLFVATTTVMGRYLGTNTTITAFATPVVGNCTNVAFVSNRVLLAKGNVLYEVAAAGTLSVIKTHYQAAFLWTTIFNIGSRIYIGGYAGSRSELHTVTTDSAGNLVQSQEAAPLPYGELLNTAVSFAGAAALCTNNGVRVADISGDGSLSYGPLIADVGDVRCAVIDGSYLYTGWSLMSGGGSGTARMALDDEVLPLQPSYGPDVAELTAQANVAGVIRLGSKTAFAVASSGVYSEDASAFVATGVIDSGRITFGTVELKGLISLHLVFAGLVASESVEAKVFDDNDVLIGNGSTTSLTAGGLGATELDVDLNSQNVGFVRVEVTLRGPLTSTPTLYRWRFRAYPIPPPVLQWVLPLIVKDVTKIGANDGFEISKNIDDVNYWIEDLYATRRNTVLRIGARAYQVRLDNFEWRPQSWNKDGFGPAGLLVVQLVAA